MHHQYWESASHLRDLSHHTDLYPGDEKLKVKNLRSLRGHLDADVNINTKHMVQVGFKNSPELKEQKILQYSLMIKY